MWPGHLLIFFFFCCCCFLRKFKLGKDITRWILTFYTNINSSVYVNGQYSQLFDVKRGTRQGDPLSPYFFLICAALLASAIRQNEKYTV